MIMPGTGKPTKSAKTGDLMVLDNLDQTNNNNLFKGRSSFGNKPNVTNNGYQ